MFISSDFSDDDEMALSSSRKPLWDDSHRKAIARAATLTDLSVAMTDDDLFALKSLKRLHRLLIDGCAFNGSGLRHLQTLANLESLTIRHYSSSDPRFEPRLDDDNLAHLQKLSRLTSLTIDGFEIKGPGLAKLDK